jgi:malate:Na+ symporter
MPDSVVPRHSNDATRRPLATIANWSIGIVPLPLAIAIIGLVCFFIARDKLQSDITTNIAVLALGGFACAEIGKRLPGLRKIGAAAILATFVPSFLVYVHAIPPALAKSISTFTDQSNFLYLFIAAIITGSILGMDRRMLVEGFLKILVPIVAGSLAAVLVGCTVGTALGLGLSRTAFQIVLPVMAGGVGEGVIPLSIGYASLGGGSEGVWLAEILPAAMFGSLTAILLAGGLNMLGKRLPHLTGNGRLQSGEDNLLLDDNAVPRVPSDLPALGSAIVLAMTLYLAGAMVQILTGFPGPVTMLLLVVALKLSRLVTPMLEQAAHQNYRFFATLVTYPLLFAIGVAKTPWEKLAAAFNVAELLTIVSTVTTLVATGFLVGKLMRLYPIDAGIVTACRASQGGTGDVAILSACDRMMLMPFAQVATRIGGAITVTVTLLLFSQFHS